MLNLRMNYVLINYLFKVWFTFLLFSKWTRKTLNWKMSWVNTGKYNTAKIFSEIFLFFLACIYLFRSTMETLEQCVKSKLTIKAPERSQWHPSDVFIAKLEWIFLIFFALLNLNMSVTAGSYQMIVIIDKNK